MQEEEGKAPFCAEKTPSASSRTLLQQENAKSVTVLYINNEYADYFIYVFTNKIK